MVVLLVVVPNYPIVYKCLPIAVLAWLPLQAMNQVPSDQLAAMVPSLDHCAVTCCVLELTARVLLSLMAFGQAQRPRCVVDTCGPAPPGRVGDGLCDNCTAALLA